MPKTKKLRQTKKDKKGRKTIRRKNNIRKHKTKKQYGGNNNDFMNAAKNADLEYVKQNITNIDDLSYEDIYGNTPLDNAINGYNSITHPISDEDKFIQFSNYENIIRLLLEKGASGENIALPNFNFGNINLKQANLKNSYLYGSNMFNANLEGANLQNANLSKVDLTDATLELTNLTNTNFNGANLENTKFNNAVIDGTIFTNTIMEEDDDEYVYSDGEHIDEDDSLSAILNDPNRNRNIRLTTDLPEEEVIPYSPEGSPPEWLSLDSPEGPPPDLSPIYSPPPGNNNNLLLNLMDSYRANNYQSNDENQSQGRMSLSELETEEERNERLLRERNEKKQKYLERPKVTLNMNETNPFENVGLTGYDEIEMEEINFCDYIEKSTENVIFIYDKQIGLLGKPKIKEFLTTETLDETKIVYECKELSEAFVPHEENIVSGPMLNMRILTINGLTIPLNELDAVVNGEHQIFVIETINDKKTIPIASLPTRLAMGDESEQTVVSADHCQAEVSIKVGKISYVENQVLLKQCDKKGGKKKKTRRKKQKKTKRSRKNKKNKKTTKK